MDSSFVMVIITALAVLFFLNSLLKFGGGESWTVYGTDGCGWTRKQLTEMDSKGISYTYINCEKEKCDGISGFPTLKSDDGETKVGFTKF